MRVLVVDETTESQAFLAGRINLIDKSDLEALDIDLRLAGTDTYLERISNTDVLLLGPAFEANAKLIASKARSRVPDLHVVMFVSDREYSSGVFRLAHQAGARKVLPISASPMDVLQELILIHEEMRARGKIKDTKLIVVTHAKGSVGATTCTAALGEYFSRKGKRTLLWDFDVETKDLTRALGLNSIKGNRMGGWLDQSVPINKQTLEEATEKISNQAFLLAPPRYFADGMKLVGDLYATEAVNRVIELARANYEYVIVDTAGKLCPATGALIQHADFVLVVIEDSLLGLTAVSAFMACLNSFLPSMDTLRFLCSGLRLKQSEVKDHLKNHIEFPEDAWELPVIPFDAAAGKWPGSGKTLLSMGSRSTRAVLEKIGDIFEIYSAEHESSADVVPFSPAAVKRAPEAESEFEDTLALSMATKKDTDTWASNF